MDIFNLLIILINLIQSIQQSSIISLNISRDINLDNLNSSSFYNQMELNNLITNISIGTPKQNFSLILSMRLSSLVITSTLSSFNNLTKKYNLNDSSTFYSKNFSDNHRFGYDEFRKGILSRENFEFSLINLNNLNFILATEEHSGKSGTLGLNIDFDRDHLDNYSLLKQLKDRNLISSYIYSFIFEKNDNPLILSKGNLIIGSYPHDFKPDIFKKEKYYEMKCNINLFLYNQYWEIKHLIFLYGNNDENDFTEDLYTKIDFSYTFIVASNKFKNFISELFTKYYGNKCVLNKGRLHQYYSCDKNININKLENINIFYGKNNFTFVLTPSDLFTLYDDKLFYLICFSNSQTDSEWSLGSVFLKKFPLVFDQERKVIGYYADKEKIYDNTKKYLKILLFISVIIIIVLLFFIIHHTYFSKRKVRANELEENVEYKSINE